MWTDEDSYTELCGCVWKNGEKIKLCPRHKHKDVNPIHKHLPYFRRHEYMC